MGIAGDDQSGKPRADPEAVTVYKTEPYVVSADVYAVSPTRVAVDGRGTPVLPAGCIA